MSDKKMSTGNNKFIHESYHKKRTRIQNRIINNKNFTYRVILSVLHKYLKGDEKILDIGSGAGTLDFYLASKGYRVTGVDISQNAIKTCQETAKNIGIKNIQFKEINFPKERIKGRFDFVIFSEVIEHIAEDYVALKKIFKLLKPGGILFLTTPSSNAPLHRWGLTKEFDKKVGHVRRYQKKQLMNLLESTGFLIVELKETEGVIRNFFFINSLAGQFIRFLKFFLSDIITIIDNIMIPILGGSNYIVVARKKKLSK